VTVRVSEVGVARVVAADVLAAHQEWRAGTTGAVEREAAAAVATLAAAVSEGAAAGLVKLLKAAATAEGSLTMEAVVGYLQVARASVHR